jgi:phospho-N-acetylmuramoyl-pentapeptide-transferase
MSSTIIVLNEQVIIPQITKVLLLSATSFLFALAITPLFTYFAYKYKWWKQPRDTAWIGGGDEKAPVYHKLHASKHDRHIPTMAGVIIWGVVLVVTLLFNLDRAQTWLPLFTLVSLGLMGLIDDYINIRSTGGAAGIKGKFKMAWILLFAGIGAWWFYSKLGYDIIHIPAWGDIYRSLL